DLRFFNALQSRSAMIEFMKTNCTYSNFHDVYEFAEKMKAKIVEYIEASKWLHGDEISDFIREKIEERVSSIQIYHDFDEFDKNTTYLSKMHRDLNNLYFSYNRKSGVVALDTLIGLRHAFQEMWNATANSTD
ncbi:hypothetical protein PMAYCL1PPCAC_32715, partial [Pristionchus mayeri]